MQSTSNRHLVATSGRQASAARLVVVLLLVVAWAWVPGCGGEGDGSGGLDAAAPGDTGGSDTLVLVTDVRTDAGAFDAGGGGGPDGGGGGEDAWTPGGCDEPGGFGCACFGNDECTSGFCVPWDEGYVCTQPCLADCPTGWDCRAVPQTVPDVVFVCWPGHSRLCLPCADDSQCGGGYCLTQDDGGRCTRSCGDSSPCPSGYDCVEAQSETQPETQPGASSRQCVPASGACDCGPWVPEDERTRACNAENEHGLCWGEQSCDLVDGWSACSAPEPLAETCNGRDDDCDGAADEQLSPPGDVCENTTEDGTCTGAWICDGEGGWRCNAATPEAEACDYVDNDCDGAVDEDFKLSGTDRYGAPGHCGVCNYSCDGRLPNATAVCDAERTVPTCVVAACDPGYFPFGEVTCLPVRDPSCLPCATDDDCTVPGNRCVGEGDRFCARDCGPDNQYGVPEGECPAGFACSDPDGGDAPVCLPASGSCTCRSEEDAGATRTCTRSGTLGTCRGLQVCDPATGWSACDAPEAAPETCNGVDDDCDGLVDEELTGPLCALQAGECAGARQVCGGALGWLACSSGSFGDDYQVIETLCDGLDNDCDGETDDVDLDRDGHRSLACGGDDCDDLQPLVHPGQVEICGDGADNDCNGVAEDRDADEDRFIAAACGGPDCNDDSPLARPGLDEVCGDGLDNDCDGSIDNKDEDGDFFLDPACGGIDCDDTRDFVHPGALEQCNALDDDCNGVTDDKDADADGHIDDDPLCGGDDCDDGDPLVRPGRLEICGNLVDEDCSGHVDDRDLDDDGHVDDAAACGGDDCDDLDPLVNPLQSERYDTKDTDCDGLVDEGFIPAGAIIVTEVMANPSVALDELGEWFEVYNDWTFPVNLDSWTVKEDDDDQTESFVIHAPGGLVVAPGESVVLCVNADLASNGGVPCDYEYAFGAAAGALTLSNASDNLSLVLAGQVIDRVSWSNPPAGRSRSLDPNAYDRLANDTAANWCAANPEYGDGDRGSPGAVNPLCSGTLAVLSVWPTDGVDNGGDRLVVTGAGLTGATDVRLGGTSCTAWRLLGDSTLECTTPAHAAGDVTVTVYKGGATASLVNGYRYTGEAVSAINWCDLQWPSSTTAQAGVPTELIYGQVRSPGVTEPNGPPAGILAQVGYGPRGTDPRNEPGWRWGSAVYERQYYENDEFRGTLTVPAPGTYAFGYRFSDDGGVNFMYCDFDPGTADGFVVSSLGRLTVQ